MPAPLEIVNIESKVQASSSLSQEQVIDLMSAKDVLNKNPALAKIDHFDILKDYSKTLLGKKTFADAQDALYEAGRKMKAGNNQHIDVKAFHTALKKYNTILQDEIIDSGFNERKVDGKYIAAILELSRDGDLLKV